MTSEVHADERVIHTPCGPARLRRSARKTLAISVLPDGSLELVAPEDAGEPSILAKVEKRRGWIARQRRLFKEMHVARPIRRHVNGATHRYLGKQYRLKLAKSANESVKLTGGYFHISGPELSENKVEELLGKWLRERAKEQFARRLATWNGWCRRHGLQEPRLRLLAMPKRWGSARPDGSIRLNPELVRAPSRCIDYVIAHEICHLKHPGHDKDFHRLLHQLFPAWQDVKARLESIEL